jgi:SnoaL-like domain
MDMALLRKEDTGWRAWATIRYRDTYVKTAGGWRFSERVLEPR